MPGRTSVSGAGFDPLAWVTAPPENETEEEQAARLDAEAEAKRTSDRIDEELQREWKSEKKGPKAVKVLLLGQSESGKSTTLKNFQLMNSPKAFRSERASWRAVIHLNVVRSIHLILEALAEAQTYANCPLTPEHRVLKMRLGPLVQVEDALVRKLAPGAAEHDAARRVREVAINSQFAWKGMLSRLVANVRDSMDDGAGPGWDDIDDTGRVICACRDDMISLWGDPVVKEVLRSQGLRLEELPGFFLDSLDRIATAKYLPTDDDILKARLKTLGVTEHRFVFRETAVNNREWRVFDVGGHRSLRAAWAPFFDDIDAILFLAPISCFDQTLEEDPNVNRIEDSFLLWKSVVQNPLLRKTSIVLFLNKIDILKAKLAAGVSFGRFVVSYGARPNDYDSISSYLRRKFAQILHDKSPEPRNFYCHFTSVTDTKSTRAILHDVQNEVVLKNLQKSSLIA